MPEKGLTGGPIVGKETHSHTKEAVCIHTKKIYDACREEVSSGYRI